MLNDLKVFVAEDEVLIAYDIADAIEEAGGVVLGPVASVSDAMQLLAKEAPDIGLLDANLQDGNTGPVADYLRKQGIPIVFFTGGGLSEHLQMYHSRVMVLRKPCSSSSIIKVLKMVAQGG